jgi:hypothetical protein
MKHSNFVFHFSQNLVNLCRYFSLATLKTVVFIRIQTELSGGLQVNFISKLKFD